MDINILNNNNNNWIKLFGQLQLVDYAEISFRILYG